MLGLQLMWSYRIDEARAVFEQELAVFERHAMYIVRQEVLCYLTELECRAGNGSRAAGHGAEAMNIFEESGQLRTQTAVVLFNQAWAAALLGQVDEARRMATDGLRLGTATGDRFNAAWNSSVLGFLDVSLADYERATLDLEPAMAYLDDLGAAVAVMPCVPDMVEANVARGRIADAEALIQRLDGQAAAGGGGWATATAERGRALVAAARGDLERAAAAAESSTSSLEQLGLTFEAARSRLVLGQIHRRAKRKRVAREHLEGARDAFDRLGAVLWADRAAIGARPDRRAAIVAVRADRHRDPDRGARRPGPDEPGDGGRAVHQPEHRAGQPEAHLPQARRPLPDGARGEGRSVAPVLNPPDVAGQTYPSGRFLRRRARLGSRASRLAADSWEGGPR